MEELPTPMTVEAVRAALAGAQLALAALASTPALLAQVPGVDLGPLFRDVDDLSRSVDAVRVAVLGEAIERGVTTALGASRVGWVLEWAPSLAAGGAGRLHTLALALRSPRCGLLREAVLGGRVGSGNAAVVLSEMEALEPRLTPEAVPTVWCGLITIAEVGGPRDIRRLRPRLLAEHGRPTELQALQDRARARVMLSQPHDQGDRAGGVFDYLLRLDTEGMTVLEAALGPLSAPRPVDGLPDLRLAQQRRGDALVEIVRRAVGAADSVPISPRTQLFVTVDEGRLRDESGGGVVVGTPAAGTVLGAGTLRRMACDAGILPTVLGTKSQVLDLGHGARLFSTGQTKALWLRDGGCTMPGCTIPAMWADAHHLRHWADGGRTDLANSALLCGHHHNVVHTRRLHGQLVDEVVVWDLRDRSYDHALTGASPGGPRAQGPPAYGISAQGPPACGPSAQGPPACGPSAQGPPACGPSAQ
ncbi:MAG: DUF222 domain-containing protein, partial [Lapillicoccus sp.]